jgi:class 3 adenylate cyclase/YHS domain-containing protein
MNEGRRATPGRRAEGDAARRGEAAGRDEVAASSAAGRAQATRTGVRLRACVVVAGVRGMTQLAARLEPARVGRLLEEFFATMTDVAVAHHAVIDLLLGEAIVLFYGVPVPRRDDALRATRTAIEMQRAFLALRNRWAAAGEDGIETLGLAIGVAAGEVLIASVRPSAWLDYTAVGEPVSTAAQLCAAARGAETLIDEAVHASTAVRLEDDFLFTSRTLGSRSRTTQTVYRVAPRRGGLRVVPPRPVLDPVCGSRVDVRRAVREDEHYFCSAACARRFAGERERGA